MLTANTIRGACPLPIAIIWQPSAAVVTGNFIFNPVPGKENEFRSLVIAAKESV